VNLLDAARLGEGYALFANTLTIPPTAATPSSRRSHDDGKEHFIETFGVRPSP